MRRNIAIPSNMFGRRAIKRQNRINMAIQCQICTRPASSQSTAFNEKSQSQIPSGSVRPMEANQIPTVGQVLDLVKRILGPRKHEIWSSVVQRLQDSHGKRRCLGVLDLSGSGVSSLMNALIDGQDVNPAVRQALDSRWASLPDSTSRLVIRNGEKIAKFGSILELPSSQLAGSNAEVLEVRDPEHAAHLILAHLSVIVIRPGIKPDLPSLKHKKPTVVLLEYPDSGTLVLNEPIQSEQLVPFVAFNKWEPHEAVAALYKMLSHIDITTSPQSTKQTVLRGMLDECSAQLELSLRELETLEIQKATFTAEKQALLDRLRAKFEAIDLPAELQGNKTHLQRQMSSFSRFRFWDMDEFSEELQAYVIANYGVELERKLEWYAGCMSATQERIHQITNEYLKQVSVLDAAPLINQVHQLESVQFPVPPSCFTVPVLNRRRQLASIATPHMQDRYLRRAYAAMLATPILTGAPALLWANGMLDGSLALPAAILGFLICVRHVSKAWEKCRAKWLADYDRIQIGLAEDIQTLVHDMLEKRLRFVPMAALEGSTRLIGQREETIKALKAELQVERPVRS